MYRSWKILAGALLVSAAVGSGACAEPRGRLYVRVGPPSPIVEARIVAPGSGYVWVSGYHMWNGSAYVWTAARSRALGAGAMGPRPARLVPRRGPLALDVVCLAASASLWHNVCLKERTC